MTSKNSSGVGNWNQRSKQQKITLIVVFSLVALAVVLIAGVAVMSNNKPPHNIEAQTTKQEEPKKEEAKPVEKVKMISFQGMTDEDITKWCSENGLSCKMLAGYSNTVPKGQVMNQSKDGGSEVAKGTEVTYTRCIGRLVTEQEQNALTKARMYSDNLHLSKKGIYKQLTSPYGEKFDAAAAQYAVDNLNADYNKNALEQAKAYRDNMKMSKKQVYNQLVSPYGGNFTASEAKYAIDHMDN